MVSFIECFTFLKYVIICSILYLLHGHNAPIEHATMLLRIPSWTGYHISHYNTHSVWVAKKQSRRSSRYVDNYGKQTPRS